MSCSGSAGQWLIKLINIGKKNQNDSPKLSKKFGHQVLIFFLFYFITQFEKKAAS